MIEEIEYLYLFKSVRFVNSYLILKQRQINVGWSRWKESVYGVLIPKNFMVLWKYIVNDILKIKITHESILGDQQP